MNENEIIERLERIERQISLLTCYNPKMDRFVDGEDDEWVCVNREQDDWALGRDIDNKYEYYTTYRFEELKERYGFKRWVQP